MVYEDDKQEFDSGGLESTDTFTIECNAKTVGLLSDNMYSDPISACIRELSCNAYDAHIEAKVDRPFEVYLPSVLRPEFMVKDFGLGISEEGMKMYTSFGKSTKDCSNAYTGAFGIGAKAPFAYTSTFSVTSIHEGKKRVYAMFKDAEGIPRKTKISEEDSTEPTGLTVSFAVDSNHFDEFRDKALHQLVHMADKMTFPEWPGFETLLKERAKSYHWEPFQIDGQDFAACNLEFHNNYSANVIVIMSNVEYTVNKSELQEFIPQLADFTGDLLFNGCIMVPNGAIQPHPSRERLKFSERTKDTLGKVIPEIYQKFLLTDLEAKISSLTSYKEVKDMIGNSVLSSDILSKLPKIRSMVLPGYTLSYHEWRTAINRCLSAARTNGKWGFTSTGYYQPGNDSDDSRILFIKDSPSATALSLIKMADRRAIVYNAQKDGFRKVILLTPEACGKLLLQSEYDVLPDIASLYHPTNAEYNAMFGITFSRSMVSTSDGVDLIVDFMTIELTKDGFEGVGNLHHTRLSKLKDLTDIVVMDKTFTTVKVFGVEKAKYGNPYRFNSMMKGLIPENLLEIGLPTPRKINLVFWNFKELGRFKRFGVAQYEKFDDWLTSLSTEIAQNLRNYCSLHPVNLVNEDLRAYGLISFIIQRRYDSLPRCPEVELLHSGYLSEEDRRAISYLRDWNIMLCEPTLKGIYTGITTPQSVHVDDVFNSLLIRWPLLDHLRVSEPDNDMLDELVFYIQHREVAYWSEQELLRVLEEEDCFPFDEEVTESDASDVSDQSISA